MTVDRDWPAPGDELVVLRVFRQEDASAWKQGEDDEQRRWFEMPGPAPMANVVAAIDRWGDSWLHSGPMRHWGIWHDGVLVGGVEVRVRDDGRANLSYLVFPQWRRRGLALHAVRAATDWAFDHLAVTGVVAVVHPDNGASRRVAAAAGFVQDGWAEEWEYGETGPMLRYLLTRS